MNKKEIYFTEKRRYYFTVSADFYPADNLLSYHPYGIYFLMRIDIYETNRIIKYMNDIGAEFV